MTNPKVIDIVVHSDLCIGCGLCVYACPLKALEMQWNEQGFLIPNLLGNCDLNGDCLKVCPFNPFPEKDVKTENELAYQFLNDAQKNHPKIGRYNSIYAGYANEFRLTSSSGGLGTYISSELLATNIVDYVFSVIGSQKAGSYYEYAISSSKEELLQASETKYFPVTLAEVMSEIKSLDGKVAIIGVACFIKSIRLAQYKEQILKDKIPFLIGIICGGVKSRFFSEYLASKVGIEKQNIQNPKFRIKDHKSSASDYSYGCKDKVTNQEIIIKMQTIGDMWGTGLFKANACDYCDDVTTELADISLGDAWLSPYMKDGKGTNVIVTRTKLAENIIINGFNSGKLQLEELSLDRFLDSQKGSFNHRHNGLPYRIKQAHKKALMIPPKRNYRSGYTPFDFRIVQYYRMKVRKLSIETWKDSIDSIEFDNKMKGVLSKLKRFTTIYHYKRALLSKDILRKIAHRLKK